MNGYFYILTTIDIFVLCFMCVLTRLSESLNKKQKRGFLFAFGLIALISLLEVVTLKVDGLPKKFRWINIVSNYLGFGLTPSVCICLVYVLDKKTKLRWEFKLAILCEIVYLLIWLYRFRLDLYFQLVKKIYIREDPISLFISLRILYQYYIYLYLRFLFRNSFKIAVKH